MSPEERRRTNYAKIYNAQDQNVFWASGGEYHIEGDRFVIARATSIEPFQQSMKSYDQIVQLDSTTYIDQEGPDRQGVIRQIYRPPDRLTPRRSLDGLAAMLQTGCLAVLIAWPLAAQGVTGRPGGGGGADGRAASRSVIPAAVSSEISIARAWPVRKTLADASPYRGLQWRNVGPSIMSARVTVVVASPADPNTIYVGGAASGIWKSTDAGISWSPIFDNQPDYTIGSLAVAPSAPDVVWVGTGEANFRQNVDRGNGIYRSSDGGRSWQQPGLIHSGSIAKILIHPTNPSIVYAAALGPLRSRGGERGVYKTTDGGSTWRAVKVWDDTTGVVDLALDPGHPDVLYAASYARQAGSAFFHDRGTANGIWRSTDGGGTWTRLTNGLPTHAFVGRIGIALAASNPRVLYARIVVDSLDANGHPLEGALANREVVYRSDDGGDSWRSLVVWPRAKNPWYFAHIFVDPTNADHVYSLGGGKNSFNVSEDGGRTWENRDAGTYGDHHALWIDPHTAGHLISGHDGGISYSYDDARHWRREFDLPIGEIYSANYDMRSPYWIYVGTQDSHSLQGPSNSTPTGKHWEFQLYGDGMTTNVDLVDSVTTYPSLSSGQIVRFNLRTREVVDVSPLRPRTDFDPPLRVSWNFATLISPHNHLRLYAGANQLLRSDDRGDSWHVVSPDLTTQTLSTYAQSPYATITAIAESPRQAGVLAVGTDDGLVWVSEDDGVTWRNVTAGLPSGRWITKIAASPYDTRTLYLTGTGKRFDDYAPTVYKTNDLGATWRPIMEGLPLEPTLTITEDPARKDLVYVGTERGVYASPDAGRSWVSLVANLPSVPVLDLRVQPREHELIAATYGRSVWVLGVTPLEEGDWARREALHLFPNRPYYVSADARFAERYVEYRDAIPITWSLAADAPETTIEIADAETGQTRTTLHGPGTRGIHQLLWDRTYGSTEDHGMYVPPGRYALRLAAGSLRTKGLLEIRP